MLPQAVDFRDVIVKLRAFTRSQWQDGDITPAFEGAKKALEVIEQEAAVQAVLYLYNHLAYHEQWRDGAALLAYSLPHSVRKDERILQILKEATELAEKLATPEIEQTAILNDPPHIVSDKLLTELPYFAPRALYWLKTTKLVRAKFSLEYGTGCGSNVFLAAQLEPYIQWVGTDLRRSQIETNQDNANRLKLRNPTFAYSDDPALKGVADCVAVLDVIEHTVYGDELLAAAEWYVQPGVSLWYRHLVVHGV